MGWWVGSSQSCGLCWLLFRQLLECHFMVNTLLHTRIFGAIAHIYMYIVRLYGTQKIYSDIAKMVACNTP
uniref:Uncharacterized protein n=1 Tax=Lutzomyia longipalpis TaxID=7200 RepID=A0A7G3B773_LUTLO